MIRRARCASIAGQQRGRIKDAVSIRDRPPEAEDRAVAGHWEGDLLTGARNTHIATLIEHSSRFVMLVRVGGKDTGSVMEALSSQIRRLPLTSRSTSAAQRAPGSAARARIQTGCSGSTCPRRPVSITRTKTPANPTATFLLNRGKLLLSNGERRHA